MKARARNHENPGQRGFLPKISDNRSLASILVCRLKTVLTQSLIF